MRRSCLQKNRGNLGNFGVVCNSHEISVKMREPKDSTSSPGFDIPTFSEKSDTESWDMNLIQILGCSNPFPRVVPGYLA